ncbi:tail fiber assembly protein [Pseudomonas putida]|uniref:tail fiber assembly protein n=1 Tax=Pseudomonas putida TaxID=303 RepID=UPI002022ECE1|nr:tail fiber assembly protein [Pseudomonas putida]MCL8306347.1 tail fiber assembly protein [Pseudomonas putida]
MSIAIDWSQMVTAEMKQAVAAAELLASVQAESARLRKIADDAIAPLQDAMDLDEATAEEGAELTAWKRYRVALNRLPDQPGYPDEITWPAPPA